VCSHEVLKALGKKYIPITQWYYMDYLELITDEEVTSFVESHSKKFISNNKYEGLVNIFGKDILELIQNTKPFIIGSGAIGCEIIKNLGMFGTKNMVLTDMDHIEKSNLSRQFLFSDNDLRKSKAKTAAAKIQQMNPDTNIKVHELKICVETENIFDKKFHSTIDIYMNALDNVDARIYVDQLAIKYSKPLIDSGTMGSKGNVQVIVPHLTESYGSTKDPDDSNGIPICTIKSFPFKQAHTIQWARELFETEFNEIPGKIAKYSDFSILESATPSDIKLLIKQFNKYYMFEFDKNGYYNVLSHIYVENFDYAIKELLKQYADPNKQLEISGKILPSLLDAELESNRDLIINFMSYGFNILNQVFGLDYKYNISDYKDLISSQTQNINYEELSDKLDINFIKAIINNLSNKIKKIDFEKDDDILSHVDWLVIASNMRNDQYKIDKSDIYTTRKIAGNIIPAMITTTALIAGFQTLEYIKLIKFYNKNDKIPNKTNIDFYKNRFVNLNINYIDGITPTNVTRNKIGNKEISMWDRIEVDTNSINKIMEIIQNQTLKKVEYIMYGNEVIFDGDVIFKEFVDMTKLNLVVLIEDCEIEIPVYYK